MLQDIFVNLSTINDSLYFLCTIESFKFVANLIQDIPLPLRARYIFCCAPINKNMPFVCTMLKKVKAVRFSSILWDDETQNCTHIVFLFVVRQAIQPERTDHVHVDHAERQLAAERTEEHHGTRTPGSGIRRTRPVPVVQVSYLTDSPCPLRLVPFNVDFRYLAIGFRTYSYTRFRFAKCSPNWIRRFNKALCRLHGYWRIQRYRRPSSRNLTWTSPKSMKVISVGYEIRPIFYALHPYDKFNEQ